MSFLICGVDCKFILLELRFIVNCVLVCSQKKQIYKFTGLCSCNCVMHVDLWVSAYLLIVSAESFSSSTLLFINFALCFNQFKSPLFNNLKLTWQHIEGKLMMDVVMKMIESYGITDGILEQAISSIRTIYSYVAESQTMDSFAKGLMIGSMRIIHVGWAFQAWVCRLSPFSTVNFEL